MKYFRVKNFMKFYITNQESTKLEPTQVKTEHGSVSLRPRHFIDVQG